jgi:hypothetical protein
MRQSIIIVLGLIVAFAVGAAFAQGHNQDDYWGKPYTIQALLGGVQYDDLVFTSSETGASTTVDMSTLPQLGGAWSTRPKGEKIFSLGLEATFLLGFKFDDVQTYTGVAQNYVTASSYLWMFDISGGAYANLMLGKKLRLYGGAGPLIMLSYYNSKQEYTATPGQNASHSDTAVGFGAYARTGLELQVHQHGYLGVGVRGNWSNIDFSDVGGASEISGIAGFVTYTAGL